jgi:hypothetical protein
MDEDIPQIFVVPAAALKKAPCPGSRRRAVNDRFQAWAQRIPGNPGMSCCHTSRSLNCAGSKVGCGAILGIRLSPEYRPVSAGSGH